MPHAENCTCDYSYTCGACQQLIDAENRWEYVKEWQAWAQRALLALAETAGVKLPPPPEAPQE